MEGSFGWMGNYTLEGKITLDYKFCLNFIKVKKLQICIFEGPGENDAYVIVLLSVVTTLCYLIDTFLVISS